MALYRDCYPNRNIRHFYEVYEERHGGTRGYSWVKRCLQDAGAVPRGRRRGPHRELRERKRQEGEMIHQDASTHRWICGKTWDLVVTMDDATGRIYSLFGRAFFVEQEYVICTESSMRGVRDVLELGGTSKGISTKFTRSATEVRGYSWVKRCLQDAGAVRGAGVGGREFKRKDYVGSVVTRRHGADIQSVEQEGTESSMRGVRDVLEVRVYSQVFTVTEVLTTGALLGRGVGWTRRT